VKRLWRLVRGEKQEDLSERTWFPQIEKVVELTAAQLPVVVLTGAGISVASGIPDFRSKGGLWEKFDPFDYASMSSFREDPARVWEMLRELYATMCGKKPNVGHQALAALEQAELLSSIITQNIDHLHQQAGSLDVIEFHGNGAYLECLSCGARSSARKIPKQASRKHFSPPTCKQCNELLKPTVIFFGEPIPFHAVERALRAVQKCGTFWVVGTSADVMPAGTLPAAASENGAKVIEINLVETSLTHSGHCDLSIHGRQEEILPLLAERLIERCSKG